MTATSLTITAYITASHESKPAAPPTARTGRLSRCASVLAVIGAAGLMASASAYSTLHGIAQAGNGQGLFQTITDVPVASLSNLHQMDAQGNDAMSTGTLTSPAGMFRNTAHGCSGGGPGFLGPAHGASSTGVDIYYRITSATLPPGTPVSVSIAWSMASRVTAVGQDMTNFNDYGRASAEGLVALFINDVNFLRETGTWSRSHSMGGIGESRTGTLNVEMDSGAHVVSVPVGQTVRVYIQGEADADSFAFPSATTDGDVQLSMHWGVTSLDPDAQAVLNDNHAEPAPPSNMATLDHAVATLDPRPPGLPPCFRIPTQPTGATTCPDGSAAFSVGVLGTGPFSYQWQIEIAPGVWRPLGNDPPLSIPCIGGGAAIAYSTPLNAPAVQIGINPCPGMRSYQVRCVVTNPCGSITSNAATYSICVADTDDGSGEGVCDGGVTIDDLLYYLTIFDQGLVRGDVDDGSGTGTPDGGVTIDDLLYYLARFDAGC